MKNYFLYAAIFMFIAALLILICCGCEPRGGRFNDKYIGTIDKLIYHANNDSTEVVVRGISFEVDGYIPLTDKSVWRTYVWYNKLTNEIHLRYYQTEYILIILNIKGINNES